MQNANDESTDGNLVSFVFYITYMYYIHNVFSTFFSLNIHFRCLNIYKVYIYLYRWAKINYWSTGLVITLIYLKKYMHEKQLDVFY